MIIEGIAYSMYNSDTLDKQNDISDSETAAIIMYAIIIISVTIFLMALAIYTAYQANKHSTAWLFFTMPIAVFFPTLYLLVHPNVHISTQHTSELHESNIMRKYK